MQVEESERADVLQRMWPFRALQRDGLIGSEAIVYQGIQDLLYQFLSLSTELETTAVQDHRCRVLLAED